MKFLFLLLLIALSFPFYSQSQDSGLAGKTIILDAGHGGTALTDKFRVGPTGEREEWINLRVALILQNLLEARGARVIMSRVSDENVLLSKRAELAKENEADLFLSIHHNATADPEVNFPIIYFHGNTSENKASVLLARKIADALLNNFFEPSTPVSIASDYTIFSNSGTAVLRNTYGIPGVIAEASFFTNPSEEKLLKDPVHNRKEALAYLAAIEAFFKEDRLPILEKNSLVDLPPFDTFQEAERLTEQALSWYQDCKQAKELMKSGNSQNLEKAYDLFTRSARSFPDSFVAAESHMRRAEILYILGKEEQAKIAALRAQEYFATLEVK
ncbi:N-acetylmuramoyl-L-alanine amidase [Salinimicrobium terrae]|uniref:N-acetylmuramoyl-L-alanine amidase n=1 Tax=Salinimicrobium terrae TaxID=470866 RepID=UPI000428AE8D|nr:N-acetylmuramoyl-L-alanine amidase [Salinimicrobium terrae]